MRGQRYSGRGLYGPGLLLPFLLLLPPATNVISSYYKSRTPLQPSSAGLPGAGRRPEFLSPTEQLRQRKERERKLLEGWSLAYSHYAPLRADVVHTGGFSPRRDSIWIWHDGLPGVSTYTSVAYRDPLVGDVLVGRVEGVYWGRKLARVVTLRDPYFRVKFRYREATGFLWGTGRSDPDGHPLLEIRLVDLEVGFQAGDSVSTAGSDGIYPPGLRIGVLVQDQSEPRSGHYEVLAESSPGALNEVVLLVDRASLEVLSILKREEAQ